MIFEGDGEANKWPNRAINYTEMNTITRITAYQLDKVFTEFFHFPHSLVALAICHRHCHCGWHSDGKSRKASDAHDWQRTEPVTESVSQTKTFKIFESFEQVPDHPHTWRHPVWVGKEWLNSHRNWNKCVGLGGVSQLATAKRQSEAIDAMSDLLCRTFSCMYICTAISRCRYDV